MASALELPFDDSRFNVVLLQHVAMNISDRAPALPRDPACAEVRRQICDRLLTAAAPREAIEPAGFCALAWQDDTEAAKAWIAQLAASGPSPSPILGVVMGAGLRAAFRQPGTKSHGRPNWHPDRGV
jgi:sarcosine/dimethylglycine N-methyltransferase